MNNGDRSETRNISNSNHRTYTNDKSYGSDKVDRADRKEAVYQIIQAANKAGVALNLSNFNCFNDLNGNNIKNLWPKLTAKECNELSEMFPSQSAQIKELAAYQQNKKNKRVFNISTQSSEHATQVDIDLSNGSHHSITIENGSNVQSVAQALRELADKIAS